MLLYTWIITRLKSPKLINTEHDLSSKGKHQKELQQCLKLLLAMCPHRFHRGKANVSSYTYVCSQLLAPQSQPYIVQGSKDPHLGYHLINSLEGNK